MPRKKEIYAEVRPLNDTHAIASVYKGKNQYGCEWAIHKDENGLFVYPTTDEVLAAFEEKPRSFDEYNRYRGY